MTGTTDTIVQWTAENRYLTVASHRKYKSYWTFHRRISDMWGIHKRFHKIIINLSQQDWMEMAFIQNNNEHSTEFSQIFEPCLGTDRERLCSGCAKRHSERKGMKACLTSPHPPGSSKHHRSGQNLQSPLGGASWAWQIGWTLGQGPGRGGRRGGQRLGWGTLAGDQRRRSKSKGCRKEWEKGEEEGKVCGWIDNEWVWPLFTVGQE